MLWKRIMVRDLERMLIIRDGVFRTILPPGKHVLFTPPGVCLKTETYDSHDIVFRSAWSRYLIRERPDIVAKYFEKVATNEVQVAMVYADGVLLQVLLPRECILLWRGTVQITTEYVDVLADDEEEFDERGDQRTPLLDLLLESEIAAGPE